METFTVHSSCGSITADAETGNVIEIDDTSGDVDFNRIAQFDVAEYKKYYSLDAMTDVDILDIGYWLNPTENDLTEIGQRPYEPPVEDWRDEVAYLRRGEEVPDRTFQASQHDFPRNKPLTEIEGCNCHKTAGWNVHLENCPLREG